MSRRGNPADDRGPGALRRLGNRASAPWLLARIARALAVPVTGLFEGTVGATTSGVEGVFIRILSELDRVRHHMDVRRDELGKLSSEIQGYVELNREAVRAMADEGKSTAVPRKSRAKATTGS